MGREVNALAPTSTPFDDAKVLDTLRQSLVGRITGSAFEHHLDHCDLCRGDGAVGGYSSGHLGEGNARDGHSARCAVREQTPLSQTEGAGCGWWGGRGALGRATYDEPHDGVPEVAEEAPSHFKHQAEHPESDLHQQDHNSGYGPRPAGVLRSGQQRLQPFLPDPLGGTDCRAVSPPSKLHDRQRVLDGRFAHLDP